MSELRKITCPQCKKELEIPVELEEFSCLYCGARSKVADLLPRAVNSADYEQEMDYLLRELPKTVVRYPQHYMKITKKEYPGAYDAYEAENAEIVAHLDACCAVAPEGTDACIHTLCVAYLDALDRHMAADKRWKRGRSGVLFQYKLVLALFLCPMVKRLDLQTAEPFRSELQAEWLRRYPKEKWLPGDYDVLMEGFRKRKWCFITTAACRYERQSDDCAELTRLRGFRDGWLSGSEGGRVLIDEYYEIAPTLVACIDYCDAPELQYPRLQQKWLLPCCKAIDEGRYDDCRALYVDMVQTLKKQYLQS